jgi:hypothetical protein
VNLPDTHIHCAVHGAQLRAHPFYHDKGIHCAECATEHERRESARRQSPEQYSRWLREIAAFLVEHSSWFECDCNAYQESDTGAWIHEEEKCAAFWQDHIDLVLREAAERIAIDTEEIRRLATLEAERALSRQAAERGRHNADL